MNKLSRKLWWWSITVPLKIKAWLLLPTKNRTFLSSSNETDFTLKKQLTYFSYRYLGLDSPVQNKQKLLYNVPQQKTRYFNPINIAVEALVRYNNYCDSGDEYQLRLFNDYYNFLKAYAFKVDENIPYWIPYYLDYPKYGMKAPWVSGLTQALVLSVALRASPSDDSFIEGLFASLIVPVDKGGVLTRHPSGYPWIAEYPGDVPFVLNGQLSVLISLAEYYIHSEDKVVFDLFLEIFRGLFQDYNKYVLDNEIRYCWQSSQLSNIQYKGLHAFQLLHLYKITGLEEIRNLAMEWTEKVPWNDFCRFHNISDAKKMKTYLQNSLISD